MKAGIIGAMEQEVTLLRDKIENRQTLSLAGCEIYTGTLNGVEVALLKSGIGKTSAALGTTLLLQLCKPDVVINTGSAGGLAASLSVGDIVVSEEVRYHDADVTAFGYEPGQMAGCPAAFVADRGLIAAAEACIKQLDLNAVRGLVVSGDAFINGAEPLARIGAAEALSLSGREGEGAERDAVFAVVDAAFAQRRKTLRAALSGWAGSGALAEEILVEAGIAPSERGEKLDVLGFASIAAAGASRGIIGGPRASSGGQS